MNLYLAAIELSCDSSDVTATDRMKDIWTDDLQGRWRLLMFFSTEKDPAAWLHEEIESELLVEAAKDFVTDGKVVTEFLNGFEGAWKTGKGGLHETTGTGTGTAMAIQARDAGGTAYTWAVGTGAGKGSVMVSCVWRKVIG